jgi:hypothetical protein
VLRLFQHYPELFGLRKVKFNQILHAPGEILFDPLVGDFDVPPIRQGLQKHEADVLFPLGIAFSKKCISIVPVFESKFPYPLYYNRSAEI